MKIKENRRNWRWKVTSLHEREIEGKIEENGQSGGLKNKKMLRTSS